MSMDIMDDEYMKSLIDGYSDRRSEFINRLNTDPELLAFVRGDTDGTEAIIVKLNYDADQHG